MKRRRLISLIGGAVAYPLVAKVQAGTRYGPRVYVASGGMSYVAHLTGQFRNCAEYADRILRGATPADLPIQFPAKVRLGRQRRDRRCSASNRSAGPAGRRQAGRVMCLWAQKFLLLIWINGGACLVPTLKRGNSQSDPTRWPVLPGEMGLPANMNRRGMH